MQKLHLVYFMLLHHDQHWNWFWVFLRNRKKLNLKGKKMRLTRALETVVIERRKEWISQDPHIWEAQLSSVLLILYQGLGQHQIEICNKVYTMDTSQHITIARFYHTRPKAYQSNNQNYSERRFLIYYHKSQVKLPKSGVSTCCCTYHYDIITLPKTYRSAMVVDNVLLIVIESFSITWLSDMVIVE